MSDVREAKVVAFFYGTAFGILLMLLIGGFAKPPVETFHQFGDSSLLLDSRTGYLCDSMPQEQTVIPPCPQAAKILQEYYGHKTVNEAPSTPLPTR